MPLAIEPNAKFKVVLDCDKDKSPQPYFEFRYLTAREWKAIALIADELDNIGTGAGEAIDRLFEIIKKGLTGWGNMGIDFDIDKIEDVVTLSEANELLIKFRNQGITAEDRKNSSSPSPCSSAPAAKNAPE